MNAWSIDSIINIPNNPENSILRLIRYHRSTVFSPGVRYFLSNTETESPQCGQSFFISPPEARNLPRINNTLFLQIPGNLRRAEQIEEALLQSISVQWEQATFFEESESSLYDIEPLPSSDGEEACWAKIHVFNVGQGDTIVIELPNNEIWLIDSRLWGRNKRIFFHNWLLNELHMVHFNKIIISHLHYDHIQHIPYILDNYTYDEVLIPDSLIHKTSSTEKVITKAGSNLRRGISSIYYRMGALEIEIVQTSAVPSIRNSVLASSDPNNHELVILLKSPNCSAFLAGDTPGHYCQHIINNTRILNFGEGDKFYKVSHHGSQTGYDPQFFNIYQSDESIISCGSNNRYGHPHNPPLNSFTGHNIITCYNPQQYHTYQMI